MKPRNAVEYWNSFNSVDRESILEDLFISKELSCFEFHNLPAHIRKMLFERWEKIRDTMDKDFSI